jgi:hypothetical protein
MEENKKFSEMSLVDFVTDILKIDLEEWQKDMLRLFQELKDKKVYNNYNPWINTKTNTIPCGGGSRINPNMYPTIAYGGSEADIEKINKSIEEQMNKKLREMDYLAR